jgi:hypothetical protein
MPKELNFLSQLTGSFSQSSAGNPTVAMIEAAYRHHGLDWRYINCEQGVIGIKYWTGVDVDPGVMRQKLEEIYREE